MPNCAFLSISNTEGWFIDDDLVHQPLQALGWKVHNIPWDQAINWNQYDMVVIRSPWDYQDRVEKFIDVLRQIEASKAVLVNDIEQVLWNIDKNYLFELEDQNVEIVPSIKISTLNKAAIATAFDTFKTSELILKPMIGANADDTFRVIQNDFSRFKTIASAFQHKTCLIQPFMNHIIEEGEYSLMYFQGQLSHTILKTVGKGDYRVQEEHGGGVIPINEPEAALVETANQAMSKLHQLPLYARVDLVRTARNSFALMELELIEPCLYFRFREDSAEKFANCINRYWKDLQPQPKE